MSDRPRLPAAAPRRGSVGSIGEVFVAALGLGLTSFGGPIAHLGYFRDAYVVRRGWLGEHAFADLVALTQLLPGPASSQLGIAIGTLRAGVAGGIAAWLGFTLPSAALMVGFAAVYTRIDLGGSGLVHGLTLAAGAVVTAAVIGMARTLLGDARSWAIGLAAAIVALAWALPLAPVAIIVCGGPAGRLWLDADAGPAPADPEPADPADASWASGHGSRPLPRGAGVVLVAAFGGLVVGLPLVHAALPGDGTVALVDAFYRAGALVFGGGHVVLPLLQASVVDPGWVAPGPFLAGYGAAQAVPGPLFTVAAFFGAVATVGPGGVAGAALAIGAIFLPSFLLVFAALAAWPRGGPSATARRALSGANAAVVGLLLAALLGTVLPAAIVLPVDSLLVALGAGALVVLRLPPIVVVAVAAAAGLIGG